MIRLLLAFLVIFAVFYFGLPLLRSLTGQQKMTLIKNVVWSLICAALTVLSIVTIVILF
jgi:hypothetical protein